MIELREAAVSDAAGILAIYAPYVEKTAVSFEYDVPTAAEFAARIAHTLERYPYITLWDDGELMGYAYAGPLKARRAYDCSAEVTIYLRQDVRRRGYGRMLYAELEARLKTIGVRRAYACIAIPPWRITKRFFDRLAVFAEKWAVFLRFSGKLRLYKTIFLCYNKAERMIGGGEGHV